MDQEKQTEITTVSKSHGREPTPTDRLIPKQKRFLRTYARVGIIRKAARMAKISMGRHFFWMKISPVYRHAFKVAHEACTDLLEEEARRRALYGTAEPIIFMGQLQWTHVDAEGRPCLASDPGAKQIPLTITKYSDKCLTMLLAGHRKRLFADKTTKHKGQVDHRHAHVHAQVQEKRQEILASLDDLPIDLLEQICQHLDAKKALALPSPTEHPTDGQHNEVDAPAE